MIGKFDLDLLTMIDKATPLKEIIKNGCYSSSVYRKLQIYKKNKLIIQVKKEPVVYNTTWKGGILVIMLNKYKELL